VLKIGFFVPFLFLFLILNSRRGNRWPGGPPNRPRGMRHERG
jgi:hypothetical protein